MLSIRRTTPAVALAMAMLLAGCQEAGSSGTSASTTQAYPDKTEFAHRFNDLATQSLKIIRIDPNQGFSILQIIPDRVYINAEESGDSSFRLWAPRVEGSMGQPPLPRASVIDLCTWMILAADPSAPKEEAQAASAAVTANLDPLRRVERTVGHVFIWGNRANTCYVKPTGL